MKTSLPNRAGGFTMIEILVAMAVFSLIIFAVYASWSAILRGSAVGRDAAADVQRARIASRSLEESLTGAQMFAENAIYYSFEADTSDADFATLSFVSHLPRDFPGNGMFPGQPIRRVTFGVESNPDGGRQLYLTQVPMLAPVDDRQPPYKLVLAPNVELFRIQFLDKSVTPGEWVDEWDLTNQIPSAVQVALAFGSAKPGSKAPPTVINQTIAIPSIAVVRAYQLNDGQPGGAPGSNPRPGGLPGGVSGGATIRVR
jgi:general secretion pathway protein J